MLAGDHRRRLASPLAVLALATACGSEPEVAPRPPDAPAAPLFVEITAEAGLDPAPPALPDGSYFVPEIMGAGVALFDADGDGDLDLLQSRFPPPDDIEGPAPNLYYEQIGPARFAERTAESGLGDAGYGQALAVGDVNDDGAPDVYAANYGPDALYLNQGHGRFRRVEDAPFGDARWSSAATFCDYDRDGDLDLYVVRYLRYRFQERCALGGSGEDYCSPSSFDGEPDALYRNEGGGRFVDVSRASGIAATHDAPRAKGLGAVCLDLTEDGWPDVLVANDGEMNQLWVNRGDGTFVDEGIMRGIAVNRLGSPEASMGVTLADVDGDGRVDVFMTHLAQETNTLYLGAPGGRFVDRSIESGLSSHDLAWTGFGCGFLDLDLDGDDDLIVVNGRIHRGEALPGAALGPFWNRYAEPNLLFLNDGGGRFEDASARGGPLTTAVEVSRGLALGDLDADGDRDAVVSNADGVLRVFRNDAPRGEAHWLAVRALRGPRDAQGARVTLVVGTRRRLGLALAGQGYQSSGDPGAHFGLGPDARVDAIEVLWPDGARERFPGGPADRALVLHRGEGAAF